MLAKPQVSDFDCLTWPCCYSCLWQAADRPIWIQGSAAWHKKPRGQGQEGELGWRREQSGSGSLSEGVTR